MLALTFPGINIPVWAWLIPYVILAGSAMLIWHGRARVESYLGWLWFILGSIGFGALFLSMDVFNGGLAHPGLPLFEAAHSVGGIFGYGLTLIVCPGMTMVGIASLLRLVWLRRFGVH